MVVYTREVIVEAMKSDSGCIFMIEPKEPADGLDGRCEKKRGIKDSPWSWTRAVVWMGVPFTKLGNTRREGCRKNLRVLFQTY